MDGRLDPTDPEARLLAAQDREDRAYARWTCGVCGGGHQHLQGCPEAIGDQQGETA